MRGLLFVDCESSGLGRGSFPVEVGWADDGLASDSLLVLHRPWLADGANWDPAAEALHGISRAEIGRAGRPPAEVAAALDRAARGKVVLSDAPDCEEAWLDLLYAAAGRARPFPVEDARALLEEAGARAGFPLADAVALADLAAPKVHRARPDALALAVRLSVVLGRGRVPALPG
jgi:hypothetical protein